MHKMHYTPIISPADSSQQYNKTSKEITNYKFSDENSFKNSNKEIIDLMKNTDLEYTLHFYDEADFGSYDEVVKAYTTLLERYAKLGKGYIKQINMHLIPGPVVTISGVKNFIYEKELIEELINPEKVEKMIEEGLSTAMGREGGVSCRR